MSSQTSDFLAIFFRLKEMIISNAKLLYGCSKNSHSRRYDVVTSTKMRSRAEYRVSLVAYDETYRSPGKADVDSKVLSKSGVKTSVNLAMEDLLRKTQEELWT